MPIIWKIIEWKTIRIHRWLLQQWFILSEIAENHGITRQAVRDMLKKGEKKLFEYEEKLLFMKRMLNQEKKLEEILLELTNIHKDYTDNEVASILENVKKELNCLV